MKVKEKEEQGAGFGVLQKKKAEAQRLKKKEKAGGVSCSPAVCSGNSFGTQRQPGAQRTA